MYFIFVINQLKLHSYNSIYYYYSAYKHYQILLNSTRSFTRHCSVHIHINRLLHATSSYLYACFHCGYVTPQNTELKKTSDSLFTEVLIYSKYFYCNKEMLATFINIINCSYASRTISVLHMCFSFARCYVQQRLFAIDNSY